MTQIDFYLIPGDDHMARYHMCCRLLDKAYHQRKKAFVLCNDKLSAERVDELLWTFRDDSFIPHNLCGEGPNAPPPIQIGFGDNRCPHREILFNLSEQIPENIKQYRRIIEIISQSEGSKAIGREHFKLYRQQGFDINTHNLTETIKS